MESFVLFLFFFSYSIPDCELPDCRNILCSFYDGYSKYPTGLVLHELIYNEE